MMALPKVTEDHRQVRELTLEEGRALVDQLARRHLGISGEAFTRAWEAGELDAQAERPEIVHLAMLLPLAR
jgi:hypothetical protein